MLVTLVNEIVRVGRYLGYCWLVGLVGWWTRSGSFGDVGTYMCLEGRGKGERLESQWVGWFGEGLRRGGSVSSRSWDCTGRPMG